MRNLFCRLKFQIRKIDVYNPITFIFIMLLISRINIYPIILYFLYFIIVL